MQQIQKCPKSNCQPWSISGKQQGFEDDRHLWPEMLRIVSQLRPITIFGEQVAATGALQWWDLVASDLEREDYAATAIDLPAASVGAFHQRSRLFWVAEKLGDTDSKRQQEQRESISDGAEQLSSKLPSNFSAVANSNGQQSVLNISGSSSQGDRSNEWGDTTKSNGSPSTFWDDAVWLQCHDGKLRPTGAGISPLIGITRSAKPSTSQVADGTATGMGYSSDQSITALEEVQNTPEARIMRLHGYGNAIVAPVAIEFIRTYMKI